MIVAWLKVTSAKRNWFVWTYSGWLPYYACVFFVGYLVAAFVSVEPLRLALMGVAGAAALGAIIDLICVAIYDKRRGA